MHRRYACLNFLKIESSSCTPPPTTPPPRPYFLWFPLLRITPSYPPQTQFSRYDFHLLANAAPSPFFFAFCFQVPENPYTAPFPAPMAVGVANLMRTQFSFFRLFLTPFFPPFRQDLALIRDLRQSPPFSFAREGLLTPPSGSCIVFRSRVPISIRTLLPYEIFEGPRLRFPPLFR